MGGRIMASHPFVDKILPENGGLCIAAAKDPDGTPNVTVYLALRMADGRYYLGEEPFSIPKAKSLLRQLEDAIKSADGGAP